MSKSAVPVNLADKLSQFSELWSQKKVAVLNDYEVKLAKLKGEFVWHTHEDTDELFLVISGRLTIQLSWQCGVGTWRAVRSSPWTRTLPRGRRGDREPVVRTAGTINTGDAGGPTTKAAEILS
ncbi:cupin domain-containing protein [Streptomyces sp. NPDC004647]|uniref:cupin domain-containing protein n=1 Tax=Streptomyces sp. NPDC004647 TaxID=3154671 RepID=UPI0033BC2C06